MTHRLLAIFATVLFVDFTSAAVVFAQSAEQSGSEASPVRHTDPSPPVSEIHAQVVAPIIVDRVFYTIRCLTPGKKFDVRTEDDEVVARCAGTCTLALPLGSYKLGIYDANGQPERGTSFEVTGPGRLEFESARPDLATAGAVLGSAGAVTAMVGSILLAVSMCIDECPDSSDRSNKVLIGLGTLAAGAVATPIGWVMFAHNLRPKTQQYPWVVPYAAPTSDRQGGVIGITGAF